MLRAARHDRVLPLLLAAAAYVVAGIGTAALAGMTTSAGGVKGWRAAAWLLSLAVFAIHFAIEHRRRVRPSSVALQVALAVSLGAFGVAALGPLRAHWADPSRLRLALLSVVAWPVLTGVPAFLVALLGSFLLDRHARADPHVST